MICDNCGNQVADGMKFCGYCGSQIKQKSLCPSCGREIKGGMVYCGFCGTRVGTAKADYVLPKKTIAAPQTTYRQTAPMYQNASVLKTVDVAWYKGEVKIGLSEASGKLSIYHNRIELKKTTGGSKSYLFLGYIGVAISAAKVKNDAPVIFPMNQIAWVRESKYYGLWKSIILEMKNGEKHTFVISKLTGSGKETQECIDLIRANIR